jgi:2-amino-4-hydroxy-6-hydroxymethyldihydropteridine diphosphokinase
MAEVFLSIGSNAGNRFLNIMKAVIELEKIQPIEIEKISSIYNTEPYGYKEQKEFLNLVVKLNTNFSPDELLEVLNRIELNLGRVRKEKWHERLIDLDILFFGDQKIHDEKLIIPHPDMHNRRFVLEPICEIEPDCIHPVLKKTIQEIRLELKDDLKVERLT